MAARRKLWIVLGVLAVLAVAAVLLLPTFLNLERYRHHIEGALQSATGWEAELGALDYSIFGGMVLTVQPGKLSAPGGGSRVEIDTIAIKADLLPLLRGRLNVTRIDLIGLDIELVRESAEAGWTLPGAAASGDAPPAGDGTAGEAPEAGEDDASSGISVSIEELRVRDGRVAIEDRSADPPLSLKLHKLNLIASPAAGSMRGGGELLLDGEGPVDALSMEFEVVAADGTWRLERFEMQAGKARVEGQGVLLPDLALALALQESPLESVLAVSESVFPLPLDLQPPGSVTARISVDAAEGGELTYEATGTLSAAGFKPADVLPLVRNLKAEFDLGRGGTLEVRVLEGTAGGGAVRGTARLDSIDPPGTLTFNGVLQDSALGVLLDGFVEQSAERIQGPTALTAGVGLDLGREVLDARALSGGLDLESVQVNLPGWDLESSILERIHDELGALSAIAALVDPKLAIDGKREAPLQELLDRLALRIDFDRWPWGIEELAVAAGSVSASGNGSFDPIEGRVDIRLTSRLAAEKTAELVRKNKQLRYLVDDKGRLSLQLRVHGPLIAPSIDVDLDLEDVLRDQLGKKTEDALKGLLKGLLDR